MTERTSIAPRALRLAAVLATGLVVAGCANTDNATLNRTAIGAGAGAVTGGVVGAVSPGVSVGGGLLGGAAIGAAGGFLYDQVKKNSGE